MKISFVIVNYQSIQFLKKCVVSILDNAKNVEFEIILVNNEKKELSEIGLDAEMIERVQTVEMAENVGFGKACNVGASKAVGDILCFLNPDAELSSHNIEDIVGEMERDQNIGIIGPKILNQDGCAQLWSVGRELSVLELLMNHFGFSKDRRIWECERKICVDWVTGAALFSRKDIFDALGGFDEKFFLYFEDMDLCKRARFLGRRVIYYPDFSVTHAGGKSMESLNQQKQAYYESQDYYFEKHFGKTKGFLVKILRRIFLVLRVVANRIKLLLQYSK